MKSIAVIINKTMKINENVRFIPNTSGIYFGAYQTPYIYTPEKTGLVALFIINFIEKNVISFGMNNS